jgi:hypothetical protein
VAVGKKLLKARKHLIGVDAGLLSHSLLWKKARSWRPCRVSGYGIGDRSKHRHKMLNGCQWQGVSRHVRSALAMNTDAAKREQ